MSIVTGGYSPEGAVEPEFWDASDAAAEEHAYNMGFAHGRRGAAYYAECVVWELRGEYRSGYELGQTARVAAVKCARCGHSALEHVEGECQECTAACAFWPGEVAA